MDWALSVEMGAEQAGVGNAEAALLGGRWESLPDDERGLYAA